MEYLIYTISMDVSSNNLNNLGFKFYMSHKTYERAMIEAMKLDENVLVITNKPISSVSENRKELNELYFKLNEFYITIGPGRERDTVLEIFEGCVKFVMLKQ